MKHVFVTRAIPDVGIKMLREKGFVVDIFPKNRVPSQKDLIKHLKSKPYDAVLSLLTDNIDKNFLEYAPAVKIISNYAVGYNNIDIKETKARNIAVTNTKGTSSVSVAEHTLALMLALSTRIVEGDRFIRDGRFVGWEPMLLMGCDLRGKTLGLIGAGAIGQEVAHMAVHGFGMSLIYHDVARNKFIEEHCKANYKNTMEEVLEEGDFVSLHVPLLPSTHHLINEAKLKLMKNTAFLINTARGPVVDEKALVKALEKREIRGAGLDVYEFEPKLSKGLSKLGNVVLTPHIASSRRSTREEMARIAAQNIIDFFEGREPKGLVK